MDIQSLHRDVTILRDPFSSDHIPRTSCFGSPSYSKPADKDPHVFCNHDPPVLKRGKLEKQIDQIDQKKCYVRNSKSRICLCCGDSPTIPVWTTDFQRFWKRVCLKTRHSKSWWFIIMFHHFPCFSQQKWSFFQVPLRSSEPSRPSPLFGTRIPRWQRRCAQGGPKEWVNDLSRCGMSQT